MHPIICKLGLLIVYSYGLILGVAFLIASYLASIRARKENINPDRIFYLLFIIFISGIIGSRIFYVVENIDYYSRNVAEIMMLSRGGLSWFGGLITGIISGIIYLKLKSLPFYKIADLIVPFLALGQAIGRIGCLLNGCCFGKTSEFGFYFQTQHLILIPTQLYSSLILILIFILLRYLQEKPHKQGQLFFTYLLFYSLKRFAVEFWRADNPDILYGLTLFQIISILIFGFSLSKLIFLSRKSK